MWWLFVVVCCIFRNFFEHCDVIDCDREEMSSAQDSKTEHDKKEEKEEQEQKAKKPKRRRSDDGKVEKENRTKAQRRLLPRLNCSGLCFMNACGPIDSAVICWNKLPDEANKTW